MAPTIHLVRHAQGFHNLSREHESIRDPALTELGERQCESLREAFPYHSQLACFVASPLRRALSTCLLGFAPAPETPIVALPELKEAGDSPCDTGSSPEILRKEINHLLDLDKVPAGWDAIPEWISWQVKLAQLKERAARARLALHQLVQGLGEDEHIVVVTHGAFLHFLTDDYHGIKPNNATGWLNTEFRSYQFSDAELGEASLVETQESWTRRNGGATRPSGPDQIALGASFYQQLESFLTPGSWASHKE